MSEGFKFSVFTKPWKSPSLDQLGEIMSRFGFDGVELTVRPGFQVEPAQVGKLRAAAEKLATHGVKIYSVAGPTDEATIAACAEAGVPIVRIMATLNKGENYLSGEARNRRELEQLVPLLDKYGVAIGVQNHMGPNVPNAMALSRLVQGFDPKHVAVVWDPGHEAIAGNGAVGMPYALDVIWSHLCMVNLKNAIWRQAGTSPAGQTKWETYWTTGHEGLAPWDEVAGELKRRGWQGVLCLTANYSDSAALDRLTAEDLAYARSLFQ